MGQGEAGRVPVKRLMKRFGGASHKAAWISAGSDANVLRKFIVDGGLGRGEDIHVLLDIMQTVEVLNWKTVSSGRMLIDDIIRPRIMSILGIPGVTTVIVTMDCGACPNGAKDIVYYEKSAARRKGVVPMSYTPGEMLVTDTTFPTADDWSSFKMCEMLRRQINYYVAHAFRVACPDITTFVKRDASGTRILHFDGAKTIVFDNCLKRMWLTREMDENAAMYHSKELKYYDGRLVSTLCGPASKISEAEYAMVSWVTKMSRADFLSGRSARYVCMTTDQDIIPLTLLMYHGLSSDRYSRTYTMMMSVVGTGDEKHAQTAVFDMSIVAASIKASHKLLHRHSGSPIYAEVFLFLLGGCDNFVKLFVKTVSYNIMYDEFMSNVNKYVKALRVETIRAVDTTVGARVEEEGEGEVEESDDGIAIDPHHFETLVIDFDRFDEYAKYARLLKGRLSKWGRVSARAVDSFMTKTELWHVKLRQIMFTILFMRNVPYMRAVHDKALILDPCITDEAGVSVWGYKKAIVEGGPGWPVCCTADHVSASAFPGTC